jgi:hypothetical protein
MHKECVWNGKARAKHMRIKWSKTTKPSGFWLMAAMNFFVDLIATDV